MLVVGNGLRVVSKKMHTFKDGGESYRLTMSNPEGELCLVYVDDRQDFEKIIPWDKTYDMEFEVSTNNYKTYVSLLSWEER